MDKGGRSRRGMVEAAADVKASRVVEKANAEGRQQSISSFGVRSIELTSDMLVKATLDDTLS